jgi:hypothetical protein
MCEIKFWKVYFIKQPTNRVGKRHHIVHHYHGIAACFQRPFAKIIFDRFIRVQPINVQDVYFSALRKHGCFYHVVKIALDWYYIVGYQERPLHQFGFKTGERGFRDFEFSMWLVKHVKPKMIVELGVDYGHSTFCLASPNIGTVYAIDCFEGDAHAGLKMPLPCTVMVVVS